MPGNRRSRCLVLLAAFAGVVIGHSIAYEAAVPAAARRSILAETGHAYWSAAVAAAVVFGLLGAAGVVARHLRRGSRHEAPSAIADYVLWLLPRLSLVQVAVFVLQEVIERLAAGAPLATLVHGDVLLLGLLAQLAVAAISSLLLAWLGRVAEAIGRALASAPLITRRALRRPAVPRVPLRATGRRAGFASRAPPASSAHLLAA